MGIYILCIDIDIYVEREREVQGEEKEDGLKEGSTI